MVFQPMSASLRDRLKKSRRSFNAPLSVAKRLKVDPEEDNRTDSAEVKETENADMSNNELCETDHKTCITGNQTGKLATREGAPVSEVPGDGREPEQCDLLQLRDTLRREVREKTETLRRLKMAKMYRRKVEILNIYIHFIYLASSQLQAYCPYPQSYTLSPFKHRWYS